MAYYSVSFPTGLGEKREDYARMIARTVLNISKKDVEEIKLFGYIDQLQKYVDSEAVNRLMENPGMNAKRHIVTEDEMDGTISGTQDNIDNVLSLFSRQLPNVSFRDDSGNEIFVRDDHKMMHFTLDDGEAEQFKDEIGELGRFIEEIPDETSKHLS